MSYIIKADNVGKQYFLDHLNKESYVSLRDVITNRFQNFLKKDKKVPKENKKEKFWALKDVSFEVKEGDRIGIVGSNGAGKSTLLKVLSRITYPTKGKIHIKGRIASLLEVGTGFHPELTGRENIFLNGAILGMKRTEINRKFDEIVEFAGVEKFLDTPVKRYSSGMYVRLAFAVAAHLESEILVVDEVLAVGDVDFQKKCLGKMDDISSGGRTILFVSHNMAAVESLCNKGIFISNGKIMGQGTSREIIDIYLNNSIKNSLEKQGVIDGLYRGEHKLIKRVEIWANGNISNTVNMGGELEIRVYFQSLESLLYPVLGIIIKDVFNTPVIGVNNKNYIGNLIEIPINKGVFIMKIPFLQLISGTYSIDIHFGDGYRDLDVWKNVTSINIEKMKFTEGEFINEGINKFFLPDIKWDIENWSN